MISLVFDLDDTLICTREANELAYARAGVKLTPDMWGRSSAENGITPEQHAKKVKVYEAALRERAYPLPAADIFQRCGGLILTAASSASLIAVYRVFPWVARSPIVTDLTADRKIALLNSEISGRPGIYFDDNDAFLERVRKETRWQVISAHGL